MCFWLRGMSGSKKFGNSVVKRVGSSGVKGGSSVSAKKKKDIWIILWSQWIKEVRPFKDYSFYFVKI